MSGPRLARWLIARVIPRSEREWVVGDLDETFAALCETRGRWRATAWYWGQLVRSLSPRTVLGWWRPDNAFVSPTFRGDVTQAARRVRQRPMVSFVVVLLLSAGLGGVVAIASIFATLLYPRIGVEAASEVGWLIAIDSAGTESQLFTGATFDGMVAATEVPMAAVLPFMAGVRVGSDVRSRLVAWVSPDYFALLGGRAAAGRLIDGGEPGVVISRAFRVASFESDAAALGSAIVIDRVSYTIAGVTTAGFEGAERADVWLPLSSRADSGWRDRPALRVLARTEDARAAARATASIEAVVSRAGNARIQVRFRRLTEYSTGAEREAIRFSAWVLGGLAILVLLGASAGVANLLAADVLMRRHEMVVRAALGASRRRLAAMVLVENAALALIAIPFAAVTVAVLMRLIPAWLPVGAAASFEYGLRPSGVGLCVILAALAMLVASLPALKVTGLSLAARSRVALSRTPRVVDAMLGVQVAQSIVLMVVAGLFVHSLRAVRDLPFGFEPGSTRVARVALPAAAYDAAASRRFYEGLLGRLDSQSGIEAVSLASSTPVIARSSADVIPAGDPGRGVAGVNVVTVSTGYFKAMGISTALGESWSDGDRGVAVLSANLARSLWADGQGIGREVVVADDTRLLVTGIVADGTQGGIENVPMLYAAWDFDRRTAATIILRGSSGPRMDAVLRSVISDLDPELPVASLGSVGTLLDRGQLLQKAMTQLGLLFSLLALVICGFGIHAQIDRHARGRSLEVGIRLALGASPARASAAIWANTLRITVAGATIGIGLAVAAGIYLSSRFFGLSRIEPAILAGSVLVLGAIALIGVAAPTRRALRAAPMRTLSSQ